MSFLPPFFSLFIHVAVPKRHPLGGIIAPRKVMLKEKFTRASAGIVVSNRWVKYQFCLNYPFKLNEFVRCKSPCKYKKKVNRWLRSHSPLRLMGASADSS